MKINGKTAIVTGGASGLGRATVETLHAEGANIIIADMNRVNGQIVIDKLKERVVFAETNVTVTETVEQTIQTAMDSFGRIDILINCAGTGSAMKTLGKSGPHDLSVFKGVCDINIIGTFDFIRQAAEKMQLNEPDENGERGVIVNTSSVAAFDGQIGQVAYAASKAAIVGMTLTVARDLGRTGIRCCTICPGVFNTPLMALAPEEIKASIAANIPFPKRLGEAPEFASLARHIVENAYLNGETIRLDGAVRMPQR